MLDITIIFAIAGLLFGAVRGPAPDGGHESAPARGLGRLARPQVQWIAGGGVLAIGIAYAIAFVVTSPAYDNFGTSFPEIRLILIKLLPSSVLGLMAGFVLRTGLRQTSGYLLGLGAVFVILPFLLTQGPGLLRNFHKIKVGPWFEADIHGTVEKPPVELKIQDFLHRYEGDGDPISKEKYDLVILQAKIDSKMDDIFRDRKDILNAHNSDSTVVRHSLSNEDIGHAHISDFQSFFIHPLINMFHDDPDRTLSKENRIREIVEPYVKTCARLFTLPTSQQWNDQARKVAAELPQTLNAARCLASAAQPFEVGSTAPPQIAEFCTGGMDPAAVPAASPLPREDDIRKYALPAILLSRIYQRLGNDKNALELLENSQLRFHLPAPPQSIETHQQARFLIERGNLRKELEQDGWEADWKRAIEFLQERLYTLTSLERKCKSYHNCDIIREYITYVRLEAAQLRNNYVFSLIQDKTRRQEPDDDAPSLADIVDAAKLNYINIKDIAKIEDDILRGDSPISRMNCPASNSPITPCEKLCVGVFYTDTYALALMAQASLETGRDVEHTGIRIMHLLDEAMDELLTNCPERQRDLKGIIRQHQKLARERFPDASAAATAPSPRPRGT